MISLALKVTSEVNPFSKNKGFCLTSQDLTFFFFSNLDLSSPARKPGHCSGVSLYLLGAHRMSGSVSGRWAREKAFLVATVWPSPPSPGQIEKKILVIATKRIKSDSTELCKNECNAGFMLNQHHGAVGDRPLFHVVRSGSLRCPHCSVWAPWLLGDCHMGGGAVGLTFGFLRVSEWAWLLLVC